MTFVWESCCNSSSINNIIVFYNSKSSSYALISYNRTSNRLMFQLARPNIADTLHEFDLHPPVGSGKNYFKLVFFINSTGFVNFYFDCIREFSVYHAFDLSSLNGYDSFDAFQNVHVFNSTRQVENVFKCTRTTTAQYGSIMFFYDSLDSNGNNIIAFEHDTIYYYLCYQKDSIQVKDNHNQETITIWLKPGHDFRQGFYLYFKRSSLEIYDRCPSGLRSQTSLVGSWNTTVFDQKIFIKTYRNYKSSSDVSLSVLESFCDNANLFISAMTNSTTCFPIKHNLKLNHKANDAFTNYLPLFQKVDFYQSFNLHDGVYLVNKPVILFASRDNASYKFFRRSIASYIDGFTDGQSNFWLGLDILNKLTSANSYNLRVVAQMPNRVSLMEEYSNFKVGNMKSNFKLSLGKLVSGKYANFAAYNNTEFSAMDFGDKNLAKKYSSGFWHIVNKTYCFSCTDKLRLKVSSTIVSLSHARTKEVFKTKMFLVAN